jgi:hypothetical protein
MTNNFVEVIKKNPTIAITLLSALSYFCTFQYEKGVCSYYRIPSDNIEIGITNILVFTSLIIIIAGVCLVIINVLFWDIAKAFDDKPLTKSIIKYFFTLILLAVFFYFLFDKEWRMIVCVVLSGTMGFYSLVRDYKKRKKRIEDLKTEIFNISPNIKHTLLVQKVSEKLKIQDDIEDSKSLNVTVYVYIMIILAIPYVCFKTGFSISANVVDYQAMKTHPNLILLKKYNENYFFREFNNAQLKPHLLIIKHGPQTPIDLIDIKIDSLKF